MKLDKYQIGVIAFFLLATLFILIGVPIFKKRLIKNHNLSIAKITYCYYGGPGNLGTTVLYDFYLNEKKIEGTSSFQATTLSLSDTKLFFVGITFPVIYDPSHPEINNILVSPENFKAFNIPFPDSLKWTLNYVDKK